ncbi:hypothetical protein ABH920_006378 [Catenulispora sp. EB89]|uniref:2OG-Fe(II)-dependent halogenase WelO5 family protein n=1 Tax=Catenulispora sp. EB89 TaxID=3156257 RepID=UPI0035147673
MNAVLDVAEIRQEHVDRLVAGDVSAVRVRGFVSAGTAVEIGDSLARHWSLSRYRNTPELVRVGESHWETHDDDGSTNEAALEEYLRRADMLMNEIRAACAPHQSPLDQLWLMLEKEFGLERARIVDREMFAGIGRVFPEGTELLPHNDRLARDAPGLPLGLELDAQLAANIYLRAPEVGGELQIWNLRPTEEQLASWQADGSGYGTDRSLVPAPDVVLAVAPGDLVVIDATALHGVAKQIKGTRIGLSCFLGVRNGRPWVCWS